VARGDGTQALVADIAAEHGIPFIIDPTIQAAGGHRRPLLFTGRSPREIVLEPPAGSAEDSDAPDLLVLRVPEDKTVKNRVHLDLRPDDQAAEVARLEGLGARRADIGQAPGLSSVTMADPEGNEFDVLAPLPPGS
jgi:Glyoxalase-like domain